NHIFFNSGKYDTDSSAGKTLLAHELTHTIQQGASPVASNIARKHQFTAVQTKSIQMASAPQLDAAVALARGEQGKVIANKAQPNGERVGADRLVEYFKTTFGEDKIIPRYTGAPNTVVESLIRKKTTTMGQVPNQPDPNMKKERDAMPSWCGIFVFWALNKAGIPMPKWKLGMPMMKPGSAYPAGYTPQAGDIAYRAKNSHYGIVTGTEGGKIKSVNGNTAGTDNLGGEIQEQLHEPSQWQGFFNPLALATGPLTNATGTEQAQQGSTEPARSLRDLRKAKYKAQRKENTQEETGYEEENTVAAKLQMSEWSVSSDGTLQRNATATEEKDDEAAPEPLQRSENTAAADHPQTGNGKIQTKTNASARHHLQLVRAETLSRIHRSPQGLGMIQGGWFDDAWDAVSGAVSAAAEWIEQGLDAAKEWLLGKVRDFVLEVPGYRLLRYILGYDPITGEEIQKTPDTLLDAVIGLIPLYGHVIRPVLDYFNATAPVANWLFNAVNRFIGLIESIGSRFEQFWDSLSLDDVADPDGVMRRVVELFTGIVSDVLSFVEEAASTFLNMVKEIALTNIGQFVQQHFPNAFDLLCVVLGENPITHESVPRNGGTIMNAGLKVLGERGEQIKQQIVQNGIYAKAVAWIDRAIQVVTDTVADITNIFSNVWNEIRFESLFTPVETFLRISEHFTRPITRVTSFISDAVIALLRILKDALMSWLSRTARNARGYFLITVILGRDPFTGQEVERNAENLIHGFMSLMEGGEEQFQQMKESGAIDRTTAKIMAAIRRLNFTWEYIVGLFTSLWESLDWNDFLRPLDVFRRIIGTFADPVRRLVAFVIEIIKIVIEVLLVVMNFPTDLIANIFRRIVQVIAQIRRDPIGFLKNLLRAIKQGFVQFFDNILQHLLRGLADWLFGQLGAIGIQMPPDLSFRSILNLVMQILGISLNQIMDRVWRKLAERIGQERVDKIRRMVDRLEGIWRFVRDVMERGPIAIWEYIQQQLSNLWDTVIDSIKNWIMERVINAVVTRLLSMLDPTGIMAVINSVIAIYRAIQSFIEYLRQMLEIVNSFVNGVAEIASGNIQVAADYLERTAARFIPIMIGFLANQVGLGRIAGRIVEMIERVRGMVSRAIDWLIDRALNIGMPIINGILAVIEGGERLVERGREAVRGAASAVLGWLGFRQRFTTQSGEQHTMYVRDSGTEPKIIIESTPTELPIFFNQKETEINASATMAAEEKVEKTGKIRHGRNLLQGLSSLMNSSKRTNTNNPRIPSMILELSQIVQQIDPAGVQQAVPPASIVPGFTNSKATSFAARHLYKGGGSIPKNHADGGAPTDANLPEAWQVLRDMQLSSRWVRFHILNEKLGGVAADSNLIPTPSYFNNEYRSALEDDLKRFYRAGLPIWLQANITYRSGYNNLFVNTFNARAGAMKYQNNQWVEDPTKQKQFSGTVDAPTPMAYNINNVMADAGEETLLVNTSTVTRAMIRLLRINQPPGGYTFFRQMERTLASSAMGRPMLSMDHDYVSAQSPSNAQLNTINAYRRGLASVNWSF
ncbi:MAG TPA: DUF4157 domain-containing protein, partial [Phnomibacter sp.]|nr:DUF4157 domain-containing protein [Phnomibacter sp.]